MPKKYPPAETLSKLKGWCDRQERCHQQVRRKLGDWGYFGHEAEAIISELISGNYLNEARFAEAFVSGRYRIKGWGRKKIEQHLQALRISDPCIRIGLKVIDDEEYITILDERIERKMHQWSRMKPFDRKGKVAQFMINKGFEPDLVWDRIKALELPAP